jgi:hypothetical protein
MIRVLNLYGDPRSIGASMASKWLTCVLRFVQQSNTAWLS